MALSAEQIAVNAAVAALAAAWRAYIVTLSAGDLVRIVFVNQAANGQNAGTLGPRTLEGAQAAATTIPMTRYVYEVPRTTNDASNLWFLEDAHIHRELGGLPLFWKVTNDEDLLTSA